MTVLIATLPDEHATSALQTELESHIQGTDLAVSIRVEPLTRERFSFPWSAETEAFLREASCVVMSLPLSERFLPLHAFCHGAGIPVFDFCESPAQIARDVIATVESALSEEAVVAARSYLSAAGYALSPRGLVIAATRNDSDAINAFCDAGIEPNARGTGDVPALHMAIRHRAWDAAYLLLEQGADPELVAADRHTTALAEACGTENSELVATLVARGVDVDADPEAQQTPLMIAVGNKDATSAVLLLKAGADPYRTDGLGMSAAKYATLFGLSEVIDLIS